MTIAGSKSKNCNEVLLFSSRLWAPHLPVGHKGFFTLWESFICPSFPLLCFSLLARGSLLQGGKMLWALSVLPLFCTLFQLACPCSILLTDVLIPWKLCWRHPATLGDQLSSVSKHVCSNLVDGDRRTSSSSPVSTPQLLIMKEDLVQEFTKLTLISSGLQFPAWLAGVVVWALRQNQKYSVCSASQNELSRKCSWLLHHFHHPPQCLLL